MLKQARELVAAEEAKRTKYGSLCDELDIELFPMAMDTYGASGPGFNEGIQRISTYVSTKRGSCPATERRKIVTGVSSVVLQRTAVAINRRRLHFYALDV